MIYDSSLAHWLLSFLSVFIVYRLPATTKHTLFITDIVSNVAILE